MPDAQAIGDGDPQLRAEVLDAHSGVLGLKRRHLLLYGGEQGGLVRRSIGDDVDLGPVLLGRPLPHLDLRARPAVVREV